QLLPARRCSAIAGSKTYWKAQKTYPTKKTKPGSAWQDAMRSTSERRLAKQQRHEVVCCVKTTNFCRPGGAVP
ncbi:MAG: hypothetical protein WCQ77_02415, partial [Planctomycetota bacterium]